MYHTYVLYSADFKKLYVGCTCNLNVRLALHNDFRKNDWTVWFRPWTLVHVESFKTKREAELRRDELNGVRGKAWLRKLLADKAVVSG